MSTARTCPHCGTEFRTAENHGDGGPNGINGMISPEVTTAGGCRTPEETITALTQEVRQLRQTVARLRAASHGFRPEPEYDSVRESAGETARESLRESAQQSAVV